MVSLSNKILNINTLRNKIFSLKKNKMRVGLCHGVFDLVHIGHIQHFIEAKKYCDILCVTITEDKYVSKSLNKPVFDQNVRSNFLSSLEIIDYVAINKWSNAINTINYLKPNFYIKGSDYKLAKNDLTKKIQLEREIAKKNNCKVIFTNTPLQSSTKILNNHTDLVYNTEQKKFLNNVKNLTNFNLIQEYFKKIEKIRSTVIGEAIIDNYITCEPLGKSGKEPILMFKKIKSNFYVGGALHVANNLSLICKKINLISMIGDDLKFFNLIKNNLRKNIKSFFVKKKSSTTIVKSRYLDQFNNNKIFGTYDFTENELDINNQKKFNNKISSIQDQLIIVTDFSHGFLNKKMIKKILSIKKSFIAVNAQLNASNISHHNLMNYNGANLLIINEGEIRHQTRDKVNKIEFIVKNFTKTFKCNFIVVTRGSNGSLIYINKSKKFQYAPAFATQVVDKIGAGDTMLTIIAACLSINVNPVVALFLGNIAGRMAVESLGNKNLFENNAFLSKVASMLK